MNKQQVIDFLVKCGIWVKDGQIAKADVQRAKVALENMKKEAANVNHGQPVEATAVQEVAEKDTPSGKVVLIDGGDEWRIRLPDGSLKGMATKHLNIDQAKKYFHEMSVEKIHASASGMEEVKIEITVKTDASREQIEEVAEHCFVQLETLSDEMGATVVEKGYEIKYK